ncbi:MAG: GatB/YqeY domain-containing protein [SAR202 cluster bacterium]|nr:GatB/YqeY domain-containing protein [SAR202 cluster bacterium]
MTMKERLDSDLKSAMRDKDVLRRGLIRYLRSEIHNQEIAKRADLDEEGVLAVLSRQAQQRRDSIEAFKEADRTDLVDKERAELDIILEYLPQQLSAEEITALVQQAVKDSGATGPSDMGKVMGRLMPQVRGKAEGRQVSSIVTETLKGLIS